MAVSPNHPTYVVELEERCAIHDEPLRKRGPYLNRRGLPTWFKTFCRSCDNERKVKARAEHYSTYEERKHNVERSRAYRRKIKADPVAYALYREKQSKRFKAYNARPEVKEKRSRRYREWKARRNDLREFKAKTNPIYLLAIGRWA